MDENWTGAAVHPRDGNSGEAAAMVTFIRASAHTFGPPSDEVFTGHRLAAKGVEPYGAYEVHHSQWIAELERMNSVHPRHDREHYVQGKRHFILSFHDSTFECIARNLSVTFSRGPVPNLRAWLAANSEA